ncbi:MAG: nucleotidyl transferase AbiEii/AbiGii toxin family protein [Dehalococcoidia bacterium]
MPDEPPVARLLRVRMAEATAAAGKPQYVVEKDYALSYLLAAMGSVDLLRDSLVFKGGTCLRKAYFPGYRFSEDLDFTSRTPLPCDALLAALQEAAERMRELLDPIGPFVVVAEEERHRDPHPRGQCVFRVRVQFPWMRAPQCSLKVEVSAEEPLVSGSVERPLIHSFPEETLSATLACYSLEEIAAEKLRALLQSRQHLDERGWLRNRPRDLYDLHHLWLEHDQPLDWDRVGELLPAKARAYDLAYEGSGSFLDDEVLNGIERDWDAQLADFVPTLPSFGECRASLEASLDRAFGDAT